MSHEDLLELGFKLYGVEENDPYYKIHFKAPIKFGVADLSGSLNNGIFWLYNNDVKYTDINKLKEIIDIVGSEIFIIS